MDSYIGKLFDERLAGIPLWAWQRFLCLFTERWSDEAVRAGLDELATRAVALPSDDRADLAAKIREIGNIIARD